MKLEIPVLKRCCFCLPLRQSLLAWGCFKMIADALLITVISISLTRVIMSVKVLDPNDDIRSMISNELLVPVIAFAVFIVDFVVTLMFVFGGLQKSAMLTELFYFISIAMWIFSLLVTVTFVVIAKLSVTTSVAAAFSFYFLIMVVQTYFLILLRSVIIKLKNIDVSRSQRNAVVVESTKGFEEILAGEVTGREVV